MIGQGDAPFITNIFSGIICYYFEKQIRNTWKFFKCGAGKGWRRSVAPIVVEMRKCNKKSGGEEYPTNKRRKANWIGHIFV